jgi:hypothetical protein
MSPFLRPHDPAAPSGRQIAYVPSPLPTPRHPNFRFKGVRGLAASA